MDNYKIKDLGGITFVSTTTQKKPNYFRPAVGEIRKITIGDVKTGFSFSIGSKIQAGSEEIIISKIVRDENSFFIFGNIVYIIYAVNKKGEEFIWNILENQILRVEFSIP